MQSDEKPLVSVIVVFRNEIKYLAACLQSIVTQFEKTDSYELILVDGMSGDGSARVARDFLDAHSGIAGKVISNPRLTLATGWNLGLRASAGRYVIRPDAHAVLHPGYVSGAMRLLAGKPDVAAVGGSLESRAQGKWGPVVAAALSMRTGVGNSKFRTGAPSGYADTAVYALYRREVFDKAGCFDESLKRHQDTEFHLRLKKQGYKLWHARELTAAYFCREYPAALFIQMYRIGLHLPDLWASGSGAALRPRHLAPFFFFSGLAAAALLPAGWIVKTAAGLAASLYLSVIAAETLLRMRKAKEPVLLHLLWLLPGMHLCYAGGTLAGLVRILFKRHAPKA